MLALSPLTRHVYSCSSTSPKSSSMSTSAQLGVHPPGQFCCTKVATELGPLSASVPGCLQGNAEAAFTSLPRHETSFPCKACGASGTPTSKLPTPSCGWTFFPSVPDHFFVSNYHCWAVQLEFLLHLLFVNRSRRGRPKKSLLYLCFFKFQMLTQRLLGAVPSASCLEMHIINDWFCVTWDRKNINKTCEGLLGKRTEKIQMCSGIALLFRWQKNITLWELWVNNLFRTSINKEEKSSTYWKGFSV